MGLKNFLAQSARAPAVEIEINGEKLTFRPGRAAALLKARSVGAEIARAVAGFFDPNEGMNAKRTVVNDQGERIQSVVTEAVSDQVAERRAKRFDASVERAVGSLLSEENAARVAVLILDSLRETEVSPEDYLAETSGAELVQMATGMLKANAPSFAPFLRKAMENFLADISS